MTILSCTLKLEMTPNIGGPELYKRIRCSEIVANDALGNYPQLSITKKLKIYFDYVCVNFNNLIFTRR